MLNSRKNLILQAIVDDYVETADPIGSEWLASHHDFGCRSATLRNEMAEMSELGYLLQPHTSAGRIPSDRGYRYYVDRLMTSETPEEPSVARPRARRATASTPVEEIVQETCRILAGMTHYPSLGTPPAREAAALHHLYVTHAANRHVLVVLLLSSGHVEHRVVSVSSAPDAAALDRVSNYLNEQIAGRELREIASLVALDLPPELVQDRALVSKVRATVVEAARSLAEERVFLEGTSHILRQREFQDVARLEKLLTALEQRSLLFQVLGRALLGSDVTVLIGAEHAVPEMQECSVVTSAYRIGDRVGGYIGVVGPTRMQYSRAVGAVGLMSRNLSALLTRASLG